MADEKQESIAEAVVNEPGDKNPGRFPALRSPKFRLIWIGQAISAIGSQMQMTTIRWHVYELTDSTVALGMIGLSRFIPIVILSLLGGAVADAKDRRRVLLATQTLLAIGATILASLTMTGRVTVAAIYAVNALSAAALAFDMPARQSLIPNLVPRHHYPNAASLNSIAMQVAMILGPFVAGNLIGARLLAVAYWINAASFLAVIIALLLIRKSVIERAPTERTPVSVGSLKEGLAFVWRTPILVWTMALDFIANFFSSAESLLPVFAKDVLHVGPESYGLLSAAEASGSVLAGAFMTLRPPILRQGITMLGCVSLYGAATVAFGASHWFWVTWAALAVIGAADTISTILRQTIRQLVTPDSMRGRMTSVNMIFVMGGPQLGNLEAGVAARLMGTQLSVVLGGMACVAAAAWVAARAPVLRHYGREDTRQDAREDTGPAENNTE